MERSPVDGDEDSGSPKFRQQEEEEDIAIAMAIERMEKASTRSHGQSICVCVWWL